MASGRLAMAACLTMVAAPTRAMGHEPDGAGISCLTGGDAAASFGARHSGVHDPNKTNAASRFT